jgi:hypothetical protein
VELTREDAEAVEREMAKGNKLYPFNMAFYVRGEDLKSLRANVNQLNALLLPNGLQPILHEVDLLALDSYIRNLPMAYDVALDKRRRRSPGVLQPRPTYCLWPLEGTGAVGVLQPRRRTAHLRSLHRADRNALLILVPPAPASRIGVSAAADGGDVPPAHLHHQAGGSFSYGPSFDPGLVVSRSR